MHDKISVEFSLALNNRTGRFFMCRDMIQDIGAGLHEIRYWRLAAANIPQGFAARTLGRLMSWEIKARTRLEFFDRRVRKLRAANPLVFTDALQVLLYELKASDTVIVYDLGPVTHKDLYAKGVSDLYERIFLEIVRIRPRLIFISQSSRAEFERLYGRSYSVAQVVYPGIRGEVSQGDLERLPGIETPFLLTVGSVGARKNQLRALDAFEESGLVERGFSYVMCGGPEPGFEQVRSRVKGLRWAHLTGYASEAQLRWLYSQAEGFVLPSLLEGFGIPAAEAVFRGLVPLVTRGGALHEVVGDSAILVDAHCVSSIASGMHSLASLSREEKDLRLSDLRRQVSLFSPEQARRAWQEAILSPS
jgi:glycosyltransferase involved in cell wall biosynthesis